MEDRPAYPVRLEGRLDPELSRWLWVVKWLLAIPHYIVLFFLWIAFVVLTIVAFFAILFTGRYPRGIFDFNLGVLRWTWRVSYYSYGALGTDRYPPFTLDEAPDYPATLDVAYPERLSRGLVLVKWWLLAIPQYILVGIFLGGAGSAAGESPGLGRVALVVRRRAHLDPRALRRNRARVHGAVSARPLRLRPRSRPLGGAGRGVRGPHDGRVSAVPARPGRGRPGRSRGYGDGSADSARGGRSSGEPPPAVQTSAAEPAPRPRGRAGRVVLIVVGVITALLSLALLAGGTALVVIDQTQRDEDGFLMSPSEDFSTATYAIVSDSADVDFGGSESAARAILGDVRIRSESDRDVFVGIARDTDVEEYLNGVEYSVVTNIGRGPGVLAPRGRRADLSSRRPRTSGSRPRAGPASRRSNGSRRTGAGAPSS